MKHVLNGRLTSTEAHQIGAELDGLLKQESDITLDLSGVTDIDSVGVALLSRFAATAQATNVRYRVINIPDAIAKALDVVPYKDDEPAPPAPELPPASIRAAEQSLKVFDVALAYVALCADIAWFTIAGLFKKRGIRWQAVMYEMSIMGSSAFPVVGLITFLVGGTMALQAAAQLRQFGANIFVVDLVGVSMTRELGPLITAIVIAGRSGSAVAAELATMKVTEEIDALSTMGINPTRFLLIPKVIAITLVQPLLTFLGNAVAIFGALLVGMLYLEITPTAFWTRLREALYLKDLLTGLFKSVLFANLIVTIGALCGLRTRGGADAVGRNTTTSVVASIFAVILTDAICSLVFYFGD